MGFSVAVKPVIRETFTGRNGDHVVSCGDEETCDSRLLIQLSAVSSTSSSSSSSSDGNASPMKDSPDAVGIGSYGDSKKFNMLKAIWKYILLHMLQITTVFLWYWTNGMNGIAMQSFATKINQSTLATSSTLQFLSMASTSCFVTCRQLLLGAAIGRVLLLMLNPKISWSKIQSTHWWPLSALHGVGSLATNIGFMYGKASAIQVIKLLEPFETLLLSQLLFRESTFSVGIVASMTVVVGAATSLLNLQPTPPPLQAVVAAVASGLVLSCRNVLQRKHHRLASTVGASTANEGPTDGHSPSPSSRPSSETATQDLNKLEKSVVQFTQLSFYSGLWLGAAAMLLWSLVQPHHTSSRPSSVETSASVQVLVWHPLYNVFSMIALGFCSALTHSLLNSGKRVFAICLAMLWFREGLNPATVSGLCFVGVGGCWYLAENKMSKRDSSRTRDNHDGLKVVLATTTLGFLWWFQSLYR